MDAAGKARLYMRKRLPYNRQNISFYPTTGDKSTPETHRENTLETNSGTFDWINIKVPSNQGPGRTERGTDLTEPKGTVRDWAKRAELINENLSIPW
jgi:hypothetical protein